MNRWIKEENGLSGKKKETKVERNEKGKKRERRKNKTRDKIKRNEEEYYKEKE